MIMTHPEWDGLPMGQDYLALAVLDGKPVGGKAEAKPLLDPSGPEVGPFLDAAGVEGKRCLIRPQRLGEFLRVHHGVLLVCYDVAAFHWTVAEHLFRCEDWTAWEILWEFAHGCRLHDVRLFDQLFYLLLHGGNPQPKGLEKLAAYWMRTVGPCGEKVGGGDQLAFQVVQAAHLISAIYLGQKKYVDQIPETFNLSPEFLARFGPFGLGVQVKGTIALGRASRSGLRVRKDVIPELRRRCREAYRESSRRLEKHAASRSCFSWSGGEIRLGKSGLPDMKKEKLRGWLGHAIDSASGLHNIPFEPPHDPERKVSTRPEFWGDLALIQPEIRAWTTLWTAATVERALERLDADGRLHPRYEVASGILSLDPNLEQLRRLSRTPVFEAPPGYRLVVGRLPDLVLRCQAEVCEILGGESQLGGLFRAGVDPTRFIARDLYSCTRIAAWDDESLRQRFDMLAGGDPAAFEPWMKRAYDALVQEVGELKERTRGGLGQKFNLFYTKAQDLFEVWKSLANKELWREFDRLEEEDPAGFERWMQVTRTLLDAVPRGMAALHVREILRRDADIDITLAEAEQYTLSLVDVVLPELGWLLDDETLPILARWLGCKVEALGGLIVAESLETMAAALRNLIAGRTKNSGAFAKMRAVCTDQRNREQLMAGEGSLELFQAVFARMVRSPTGRLCMAPHFTRAGAQQHVALADDAMKLVLFKLVAAGFELVACAAGEFVIQITEDPPEQATLRRIARTAEEAGGEVLIEFPPRCEIRLVAAW
jgi:hypothetical protein